MHATLSSPKLWLESITVTDKVGTTSASMPAVWFGPGSPARKAQPMDALGPVRLTAPRVRTPNAWPNCPTQPTSETPLTLQKARQGTCLRDRKRPWERWFSSLQHRKAGISDSWCSELIRTRRANERDRREGHPDEPSPSARAGPGTTWNPVRRIRHNCYVRNTWRGSSPGAPVNEPDPHRWWALVVIALAQLMVVLDATIVNIALPSAQRDLGISDANRQWVITAYTLAFGGLLLLGGRIADLVGRKRTFIIGLVGFAAASALGGAAVERRACCFGARALQGSFAALLAPSALSLLTTTFTDAATSGPRRSASTARSRAAARPSGCILGGLLTEYLNWRWCLYVNVPDRRHRGHRRARVRSATEPAHEGAPASTCPASSSARGGPGRPRLRLQRGRGRRLERAPLVLALLARRRRAARRLRRGGRPGRR